MLSAIVCLFALIAAVSLLEWTLWRRRRRRNAEIDAFMEWYSYPPTEGPPVAARQPSRLAENGQDLPAELSGGRVASVRPGRQPLGQPDTLLVESP